MPTLQFSNTGLGAALPVCFLSLAGCAPVSGAGFWGPLAAVALAAGLGGFLIGHRRGLPRRRQVMELEVANLALSENESFVTGVLETVLSGIISIDGEGVIQSVNPAAEKMFGYAAHELVGEKINLLMPEPYRSAHDGYLEHYLGTGERRIIGIGREVVGLRRDGSTFPMDLAVGEVKRKGGRRLFVGILSDITRRKAAEALYLRHSRAIEESPVMVIITDPNRDIEYVNPAFTAITGYSAEEIVGRNIRFVKSGNTPAHVYREMFDRLHTGKSWNGELQDRRKDGSLFWVSATLSPVRGEKGEIVNFVAVEEDITERKKLQDEVRRHRDNLAGLVEEQTAYIKGIVDTAADGIVTIDQGGGIMSFNTAAERMFGYRFEEVIGRNINMLMPEPYHAEHDGYIKRYLDTADKHIIGIGREVAGRRRDGTVFPLYLAVSELNVGSDKRFTGIMRDISLQKRTEAALIQAREAAEAASRAKSNFLANMSHEIRTPMNAIIGMTDLVLDTSLDAQQGKLLRAVASSAHSLLAILNDILDLSKLESGRMALEAIPFSPREILAGVEEVVRVAAVRKGLELGLEIDPAVPPCLMGDPTRLRQVLLNLAGNAVKFTERGSVVLGLRPASQPGEWHFGVRDTGIGIAEDRLGRVFERFSQADESTTRRFGGTGLGTAISREIVEHMGGRIWVESEEGWGSHFQFTVPLATAGVEDCLHSPPVPVPGADMAGQGLRILLAEDTALNQELILLRLGRRHEIVVAENGLLAVEHYRREPFDLILMDVMMPKMGGEEATRAIREIEKGQGRHVPIIMLTASVMPAEQRKYVEAGADDFVGKPIDFAELYGKIARFFPAVGDLEDESSAEPRQDVSPGILDLAAGARLWGGARRHRQELRTFAEVHVSLVEQLAGLFSESRFEDARFLAHTAKGMAGNLKANGLLSVLTELEGAAKAGDAEAAAPSLAAAREALADLLGAIAGLDEGEDGAGQAAKAADPCRAIPALDRLVEALARAELDEGAIDALREAVDAERFDALEREIDAFEFEKACAYARDLRVQLDREDKGHG